MDRPALPAEPTPIAETRRWLERAVIGLNLCPFAKAVHVRRQIRFVLSGATTNAQLARELESELARLRDADPDVLDTTLIVHPHVLVDFDDYNDFLDEADACLSRMDLAGEVQVASFHPDYRFAGEPVSDPANCTNRSPYPMLHLLREASVERAVAAFPDPDVIVERNIATMRRLGVDGYRRLLAD
jgi:uncharacterized protein